MGDRITPLRRSSLPTNLRVSHDFGQSFAQQFFGTTFTAARHDGALIGPFAPLIRTPAIQSTTLQLLQDLAVIPQLSKRAREVAILVVGAHYGAEYEMYAHSRVAVTCGLPADQIRSICNGNKPDELDDECKVAYDFAKALISGGRGALSQTTWNAAVSTFDEQGTLALMHYVGVYAWTCMFLNAVDARAPEGEDVLI